MDIAIRELADAIARVTVFTSKLVYDAGKPSRTMRKLIDVSRPKALGWQAQTKLEDGLRYTYAWFLANQFKYRQV